MYLMVIPIFKKIIIPILLLHILSLAFFLSADLAKESIFQEPIRYAFDDGVYHMRLVENMLLGEHFPKRIYFDPYTYFPYGTYVHFAPLYDLAIAGVIWLANSGQPTLELINKIAPYYPPALGLLTIIVIFFIGSVLWNRWAGLFSAFLMAISPPFLYRSLLGATDHHQAEVLFSSLTMLFLILSFKNQQGKRFWLWTLLAGLSLGLYFLVWNGALLFLFIIFVSIILYYLIEHLKGSQQNHVLMAGVAVFFIAFLMILPFANHPDIYNARLYNLQHYGSLVLGIIGFLVVWLLGNLTKRIKIKTWLMPSALLIFGMLFLFLLRIIFEPMFSAIIEGFKAVKVGLVDHESARKFVGEMRPLDIGALFNSVSYLAYFSFVGWIFIIRDFIKKNRAEDFLMATWFLIMVLMTGLIIPAIGQGRFIYYLAANISLLCGFLAAKAIKYALSGWKESKISPHKNYLRLGSVLLIFNVIFFVFYPFPFGLINSFPENLPRIMNSAMQTGIYGSIQNHEDWYETLKWLRENTPDPGVDYYAYYEEPKFNLETGRIDPYPYPETAYGILATWDVGHMITYYSHRLPTANPFQQGLGRKTNEAIEAGETTFFIETDEEKASELLDELRTKYVITDIGSAEARGGFRTKLLWATGETTGYYSEEDNAPTEKYFESMIVRLHFSDGRDLSRFRLVHESKTNITSSVFGEDEDFQMIKVFEYVKGAKITGRTTTGTSVEISARIKTNQDRKFTYEKIFETKDGSFEFTVPYAASYSIKTSFTERTINISEEEVSEGKEINLNFF